MSRKPLDKSFFKTMNEQSAYVLGFLYGDGSLYDQRICFTNKDEDTIKQIRQVTKSGHKITYTAGVYRMIWSSRDVYLSLLPYGIKDIRFPTNVPDELIHHFIRGFFDSSGHFTYENYQANAHRFISRFTSHNVAFLESLAQKLNELGIETVPRVHTYNNTNLMIYYVRDTVALYNIIYRDATIYTRWKRIYAQDHIPLEQRHIDHAT